MMEYLMNILTNAKEFWTTNPQRTFTGNAPGENGATVEIVVDSKTYSVTVVDGKWEWTPPSALSEGEHVLSVRIIDRAGNMGPPTLLLMHVDTTAPNKPEITRVVDNEGSEQGWLSPNAKTDDNTPTFSGRAEPGSVVRLYAGDVLIGSVTADSTGGWEITPQTALDNGKHSFTVTSTDKVGHTSVVSDSFDLTIEPDNYTPVPDIAVISHAVDNAGPTKGALANGALTDDTTPELRGTAPANSTVRIQYRDANGNWIDGGNATLTGTEWSWTPNPALGEGHWEFRANAGKGWSDQFSLDIDSTPGNAVDISYAWDDVGPYTGKLNHGAITDDGTPTLHGRAESNSLVYIFYRNGNGTWQVLGSVHAGADGRWQYEPGALPVGSYEFQAGDSDIRNPNSNSFDLQIITPGSNVPVIDTVWDDYGNRQGNIKNGGFTDDTTPTLKGTAEANSIVVIEYHKPGSTEIKTVEVKADSTGHWEFTAPKLDYGSWTFKSYEPNNAQSGTDYNIIIRETDLSSGNHYSFDKGEIPIELLPYFPVGMGGLDRKLQVNKVYRFSEELSIKALNENVVITDNVTSTSGIIDLHPKGKVEILIDGLKDFSFTSINSNVVPNPTMRVTFYDADGNEIYKKDFNSSNKEYEKKFSLAGLTAYKVIIEETGGQHASIDDLKWNQKDWDVLAPKIIESVENNDDTTLHYSDGNNITLNSILSEGEKDLFIDDGKTQLMVNGDAGDVVQLADILPEGDDLTGWQQQAGTVTIAGVHYNVFSHGDAELLVQEGVKTELV